MRGLLIFSRDLSGREIGRYCCGDAQKVVRTDGEDMVRRSGGSPNLGKLGQTRVEIGVNPGQMTNRGDATDGKAGLGTDQIGISLAKRLTRDGCGLRRINAISACCQEQDDMAAILAAEDDGFRDLIDLAADGACGVFGRSGAGRHLADGGCKPCLCKRGLYPLQAFAHCVLVPCRK